MMESQKVRHSEWTRRASAKFSCKPETLREFCRNISVETPGRKPYDDQKGWPRKKSPSTDFLSKPGLQQGGGWCFAKQRKLFEAAGDRWIGRRCFIDIRLKNIMLQLSNPISQVWPSARSYELGLLSFSAAEQNSPAFLRVK
ncbi:MAG: hypothetical protein AB1547_00325 [Thermodesulfobacteriota bacterium]